MEKMYIPNTFCWCWHVLYVCATLPIPGTEGLECKNWGEMSVKDTLFGRLELAVADNVCIRNGSRSNIGVQAYNTYQYKTRHVLIKGLTFNLVLWNCWSKLKPIWLRCYLDGLLSKLYPTAVPPIQDGGCY